MPPSPRPRFPNTLLVQPQYHPVRSLDCINRRLRRYALFRNAIRRFGRRRARLWLLVRHYEETVYEKRNRQRATVPII